MSLGHKIVNLLPDMMIPLNVRSVGSLDMHRKTVGTAMACLQTSEEEEDEEEVVGHIEDVDVVVINIRITPQRSLKIHHLNLNHRPRSSLNHRPHSSPYSSLRHNNPNNSRSLLPQKPLPAAGQQAI